MEQLTDTEAQWAKLQYALYELLELFVSLRILKFLSGKIQTNINTEKHNKLRYTHHPPSIIINSWSNLFHFFPLYLLFST